MKPNIKTILIKNSLKYVVEFGRGLHYCPKDKDFKCYFCKRSVDTFVYNQAENDIFINCLKASCVDLANDRKNISKGRYEMITVKTFENV